MKLVQKTRHGAKVTKRFDRPRTPYHRVLESSHVPEEPKQGLREIYVTLNPAQLKRDLATIQARLLQTLIANPKGGEAPTRTPDPTVLVGRGFEDILT